MAETQGALCENDNTFWSRAENGVFKTLLKSAKKLHAQCKNVKTSWSLADNPVLYNFVHFVESR